MHSWSDPCFSVQAHRPACSLVHPYHPFPHPPISPYSPRVIAFADIIPSAKNSDPEFCLVNLDSLKTELQAVKPFPRIPSHFSVSLLSPLLGWKPLLGSHLQI